MCGSSSGRVQNNVVSGGANYGICIAGAARPVVEGNSLRGHKSLAILVQNDAPAVIRNNTVLTDTGGTVDALSNTSSRKHGRERSADEAEQKVRKTEFSDSA